MIPLGSQLPFYLFFLSILSCLARIEGIICRVGLCGLVTAFLGALALKDADTYDYLTFYGLSFFSSSFFYVAGGLPIVPLVADVLPEVFVTPPLREAEPGGRPGRGLFLVPVALLL